MSLTLSLRAKLDVPLETECIGADRLAESFYRSFGTPVVIVRELPISADAYQRSSPSFAGRLWVGSSHAAK